MAGEELQIVRLKDDFYRDGFYRVLTALIIILAAVVFLVAISVYIYLEKPKPITFVTDNEWRIVPDVPLDKPYLSNPDLLQWVSEAIPNAFQYDFVNYSKQLEQNARYFTANGWTRFLDQINIYANANTLQQSKLFVNSSATAAPFILNQGLADGRYAWLVQMPIVVSYQSTETGNSQSLVIQAMVVRVPTLNNLSGVGIDSITVTKGSGEQVRKQ